MRHAAKSYTRAFACLTVAMLAAAWFMPACFAVDFVEKNAAISSAEHDLKSAYAAVAEAETAGADVYALLNKLSIAGDFLSRAYAAAWAGDYANAKALAVECNSSLEGVAVDAASLKMDAEKAHNNNLLLTVVMSGVGLALLLVFGLLGWKLLKKQYLRRVLDMTPQVEEAT